MGVGCAVANVFGKGGPGSQELATLVAESIEKADNPPFECLYNLDIPVVERMATIARSIYGADGVVLTPAAKKKLAMIAELGYTHFPICIAKTQYSFSTDAKKYGAPEGFGFNVQDIVINAGAEMLVVVSGDIMRMPGLPKEPAALHIDIVNGQIEGLD